MVFIINIITMKKLNEETVVLGDWGEVQDDHQHNESEDRSFFT